MKYSRKISLKKISNSISIIERMEKIDYLQRKLISNIASYENKIMLKSK